MDTIKLTKAETNRLYRFAHPDRVKEYRARPEVRERDRFHKKIWALGTTHRLDERRRKHSPETWSYRIIIGLKYKAKKRGIVFDITGEDVFATIPADLLCPALGFPLDFGGKHSMSSPSVDRLIPSLGYVRGNIAVISVRANWMKGNCTDPAEIRRLADYVECALAGCGAHEAPSNAILNGD